jgi:hypothetical protein
VSAGAALDHGFQTGLYVLTGLLLVAVVVVFTLLRSPAQRPAAAPLAAEQPAAGTLDDLALRLRGLVAVNELRQSGGAGDDELRVYGDEIARVRAQLVGLVEEAA